MAETHLDIILRARSAVMEGFRQAIQDLRGGMQDLNRQLGRRGPLGELAPLARGGAALIGLRMAARYAKELSEGIGDISRESFTVERTLGEWVDQWLRIVPIMKEGYEVGLSIRRTAQDSAAAYMQLLGAGREWVQWFMSQQTERELAEGAQKREQDINRQRLAITERIRAANKAISDEMRLQARSGPELQREQARQALETRMAQIDQWAEELENVRKRERAEAGPFDEGWTPEQMQAKAEGDRRIIQEARDQAIAAHQQRLRLIAGEEEKARAEQRAKDEKERQDKDTKELRERREQARRIAGVESEIREAGWRLQKKEFEAELEALNRRFRQRMIAAVTGEERRALERLWVEEQQLLAAKFAEKDKDYEPRGIEAVRLGSRFRGIGAQFAGGHEFYNPSLELIRVILERMDARQQQQQEEEDGEPLQVAALG